MDNEDDLVNSASNTTVDIGIDMPATILGLTIPSFAIFITVIKVLLSLISSGANKWKNRTKCRPTHRIVFILDVHKKYYVSKILYGFDL